MVSNKHVTLLTAKRFKQSPQGLIYTARVAMARCRILVEDRWVQLAPGMAVTVEVKTGERRMLEFLLSPFLEYQEGAVRGSGETAFCG